MGILMLSTKANSNWTSQVYQQDAGDADWSAYQISLSGSSQKFNINSANTTASSLSIYEPYVTSNQTLLLSTNGSTFTSALSGAVTTTSGTFGTPTKITAKSDSTGAAYITTGNTLGSPMFIKPDGTRLWRVIGTTLTEYTLSTPNDPTTATVNGKSIGGFGNYGFCFSIDGSKLYYHTGTVLGMFTLSTAWDLATINLAHTLSVTSLNNCRQLRISYDGQYLTVLSSGAASTTYNKMTTYTLSNPYSIYGTLTQGTISTTYASLATAYTSFEFSNDGKIMLVAENNGAATPVLTVKAYSCPTAWSGLNATQLGSTLTLTNSDFGSPTTTAALSIIGGNLGGQFTVFVDRAYATFSCDFFTKYNINISAFSLGAAPTSAYYAAPRVFVDMESTSGKINMASVDTDFVSGNTTQVVVGATGGNVLFAGDTLLLNGSNSVTTTNVTQGTVNGLAAQQLTSLGNGTPYINNGNKQTSLTSTPITIKFRPDGMGFYYTTSDKSVYQYGLTSPWDISTAYLIYQFTTTYVYVCGVDWKSDGTKMYLNTYSNVSNIMTLYEYTATVPWSLPSVKITASTTISTSWLMYGGRFNETGTQYYFWYRDSSNYYIAYLPFTSAYSFVSVGTLVTALQDNVSVGNSGYQFAPVMTPGGAAIVTCYQTNGYTQEQLLKTSGQLAASGSLPWNYNSPTNGSSNAMNFPVIGAVPIDACDFSPDGTRMFVAKGSTLYYFKVRTKPLTQYTATYSSQGYSPTSVNIPDRSIEQTITTTLSGGNMTFATSQVTKPGRALAVRVNSPYQGTTLTGLTINLWK